MRRCGCGGRRSLRVRSERADLLPRGDACGASDGDRDDGHHLGTRASDCGPFQPAPGGDEAEWEVRTQLADRPAQTLVAGEPPEAGGLEPVRLMSIQPQQAPGLRERERRTAVETVPKREEDPEALRERGECIPD